MKNSNLSYVKKFYFLDYFSILLESIAVAKSKESAFNYFKILKEQNQLGESKYKKVTLIGDILSESQLVHFQYTFQQVIEESVQYRLIKEQEDNFKLTNLGNELLSIYLKGGQEKFNFRIFSLIEEKLNGFYNLVKSCYKASPIKNGLLIFPIYSPLKLGIGKENIRKTKDIFFYTTALYKKLEADILIYLDKTLDLTIPNQKLQKRLNESGLIGLDENEVFDGKNYNKIVKRIRDFWLNYFLITIYDTKLGLSLFDIWIYRAKQLGIINAHEYYPGFSGKIVYPISILSNDNAHPDFKKIFTYSTGEHLYIHSPKWTENQHDFVDNLFNSYHDLKSRSKSYFINLPDLRDIVCFKMKISDKSFNEFLKKAYQLNLKNQLKIKIALESDKLPEEAKAIYLKREPVLISGKPRNIIAIDLKR